MKSISYNDPLFIQISCKLAEQKMVKKLWIVKEDNVGYLIPQSYAVAL